MRFIDPTGLIGEDGFPGCNPTNWPSGNNNQDGSYTGGSGNPSGPPSSGGNNVPQSGPSALEGPGGGTPGNNNSGTTTTKINKDGSYNQTTRDSNGNVTSETKFDKNGNITKYTVYNQDGTRTVTEYTYTKNGILVTKKENQKGILGGLLWTSGDLSIEGYNNTNDLQSGNWNFHFDNQGLPSIGENFNIVNGDLLLMGFVSFLSEKKISYTSWLFNYSVKIWDVTNVPSLRNYSFSVRGKLYNANTFGNIEVGYIGEYYGVPGLTKLGSLTVHIQRHGFNHLGDEWQDQKWMDYGAGLYGKDYPRQ